MTTAQATRHVLERLGAADTLLVSNHLALPTTPTWTDGVDVIGRPVLLVGAHELRRLPDGEQTVKGVLAALHGGYLVPEAVHPLAAAPCMAAAQAEILAGVAEEVMVDGERGTGKTFGVAQVLPMQAELHARAGYPLPFRVLWVHDSLASADAKTRRSLEEEPWGGRWQIRDGGHVAAFVLGGVVYVLADFVGAADTTSAERLKTAAHMVVVEEAVPSLAESGGVDQSSYDVARSSARMETRRRVSVVVTNPGSPEHWCYQRFISPGRPRAVRCRVPASDRLSAEDVTRLRDSFATPDLRLRLAEGEWAEIKLGPEVATGYNPTTHIAPRRLDVARGDLLLGWDSAPNAHTHAVVIGARLDANVYVYAGLVAEETGLQQFLDAIVLPWFSRRAPWALTRTGGERLFHRHDPAMNPDEGGDIEQNAIRRIRRGLGGTFREGGTSWPARATAMHALLNLGNGRGGMALQLCPSDDTRDLRRALGGSWYYAVTRGGTVVRDLPAKPNHPWEDLGDSFCYFAAAVAPSRPPRDERRELQKYATSATAKAWRDQHSPTTIRGGSR